MPTIMWSYRDRSKEIKALHKKYEAMGLSFNKINKLISRKLRKP